MDPSTKGQVRDAHMNTQNDNTSSGSATRFILLLLALAAFASFGLRTISNSAPWMHLASGRILVEEGRPQTDPFSFTTDTQRPWINAHWLYDAGLYTAWEAVGPRGVVVLNMVMGVLAFLLALRSNRVPLTHPATSFVLLICAWLLAPVFQVDPLMPALLFAGLFLFVLDRHGVRPIAWLLLLPVQWIWTNVHGTFFLGPAMAAIFGMQTWLNRRRNSAPAESAKPALYFALAATLLLVTLLNPYGLALHLRVVAAVTNPALGVLIEWISPFQGEFEPVWFRHASTLMLLMVASGFVFIRERLPLGATLLAVLGAFLLVASPRYVAISGLLAAPFAALSLVHLGRYGAAPAGPRSRLATLASPALGLLCVITLVYVTTNRYYVRTGSASAFGVGVAEEVFPSAAVKRIISRDDFPRQSINLAVDGGYLSWMRPGARVFVDPRVDVYGSLYYQGLARALLGQPEAWDLLMKKWDPGAVILNGSWPGAGAALRRLVDNPQWALIYFDGLSAIVVRRTTENLALISDPTERRAGLRDLEQAHQRLLAQHSGRSVTPVSVRLLGAGSTYLALGRFAEARAIYQTLTRNAPHYTTGWLNLGLCELQVNQLDSAIQAFSTATRQRPGSVLAWLWLGKAYEAKGDAAPAAAALQKARSINKTAADAFEQGLQALTNRPTTMLESDPKR